MLPVKGGISMQLQHHPTRARGGRNDTDFSRVMNLILQITQHRSGVMMIDSLNFKVYFILFGYYSFFILYLLIIIYHPI